MSSYRLASSAIFLAFTASLLAQRPIIVPEAVPGAHDVVESGPTGSISLDVVVSGKEGKQEVAIPGLAQQDFVITDNKGARPVTAFQAVSADQTHTPVEVTLILDSVNITYTLLSNARQQVSNYLKLNGGHLTQPTRIAVLTDKGMQVQPSYTLDGNALAAALDAQEIGLRSIHRSAGFYGADEREQLSLTSLGRLVQSEHARPGRKFFVFVSPGWPLLAGPAVELSGSQQQRIFDQIVAVSTQLRQARVTLYSVNPIGAGEDISRAFYYKEFTSATTKPSQADLGHLSLQVLAEQSGGRVFNGSNDISKSLTSVVSDASAFYELTFTAPHAEHPNEYHRIDVRLDKPGYTVRSLQGYYDQP
jgi:VWFA-related protein